MTETPVKSIIFSGDSVRAILDGRKTQDRRIVKPQPVLDNDNHLFWKSPKYDNGFGVNYFHTNVEAGERLMLTASPYKVGDELWVREAHSVQPCNCCVAFKSDNNLLDAGERWRSPIFLERRFARLFLRITGVRVERLQDITADDAIAEGMSPETITHYRTIPGEAVQEPDYDITPRDEFTHLWDKINGKKAPWQSNPWVWVLEFEEVGR